MVPTRVRKEKFVTHRSSRISVLVDTIAVGIRHALARGAK